VFKQNSTNKIRLVFDTSCKGKHFPSNDFLENGPNLIEEIPPKIMGF
jgi:hypothetical protein